MFCFIYLFFFQRKLDAALKASSLRVIYQRLEEKIKLY